MSSIDALQNLLIYFNDIYNSSNKLSFYLFADDINLLYADKNLKSLEEIVNNELLKVSEWLNANKLTLNAKKSMSFSVLIINKSVNIQMFDNSTHTFTSLECKEHVKYLGILLDSNLSWKFHIEYVALEISKIIGVIARLRHFVPLCTFLNIYCSLIFPYMPWFSCLGQAAKTHLQKLLVLEKRVLRLMYFSEPRADDVSLFITSNILPINMLYVETVSSLMYDVSRLSVPSNISALRTKDNEILTHKTRSSSSGNFSIKSSSLSLNQRSFDRFGSKLWNSYRDKFRQLPKSAFKKHVHDLLLLITEAEDNYVETLILLYNYWFNHGLRVAPPTAISLCYL